LRVVGTLNLADEELRQCYREIYDIKYRQRVVDFLRERRTQNEAKVIFKVGLTSIKKWVKQNSEVGHLKNKPLNRTFEKIDPEKLKRYIEVNPDAYLKEIAAEFKCCTAAVYFIMKKLKITRRKKSKYTRKGMNKKEESLMRKYKRSIHSS
jgi:transposase